MYFYYSKAIVATLLIIPRAIGTPILGAELARRDDVPTFGLSTVVSFTLPAISMVHENETVHGCDSTMAGCIEARKFGNGPSIQFVGPKPGITASLVNNYYDKNRHPIEVLETQFYTFPGEVGVGATHQETWAESNIITWSTVQKVETKVVTGGYGDLAVLTFLSEDVPICISPPPMELTTKESFPGVPELGRYQWVYVYGDGGDLKARDIETSGISESVRSLEARARNFEAANYREIARLTGVFMIHTAAGLIGNAVEFADSLPGRSWAGDHILELAQFEGWLNNNGHGNVMDQILACDDLYNRFVGILNAPGNLVGVDAVLNNLKMVLLQTSGPTNWNNYDRGIYEAMLNYLAAVSANYEFTAGRLATALDNVCNSLGCAAIGPVFRNFVIAKLVNAQNLVRAHLANRPAGLGAGYYLQRL